MSTELAGKPREQPLIGIEVARFACALAVLFWHYQHFYYVGTHASGYQLDAQPLYSWFWPFYEHGGAAVQVFWCLSGFIFYHKYAQPIAEGRVPVVRFSVLRFSRLYPLHIVTLILVAALQARYHSVIGEGFVFDHQDLLHFTLQLLMASNWGVFEAGHSFNAPIWSISVEIVVYALFFMLSRARFIKPWMLLTVVGAAAALNGFKISQSMIGQCLCFFYLGAFTCVVYREASARYSLRLLRFVASALLALAIASTFIPRIGRMPSIVLAVPLAPSFMLVLLLTVRPDSERARRLIIGLGNTTYSSYLIHFPLQLVIVLVFVHDPLKLPAGEPWFLFAFVLATFILAALVYHYFERPVQDWIRAWTRRSKRESDIARA